MRIAALSDIHIGVTPGRDGFGHVPAAFAAWLGHLRQTHDRVVLVGDVFQTDHGWWPGSRAAALHAARRRLPELLAGVDYVHGNHDLVAAEAIAAPTTLRLEADGVALVFTHGHQFDPVARGAQWLADVGTYTTGTLRRIGAVALASWLERRDVAIKHARFGGAHGPYARGALSLARQLEADLVVMGHTHAAELHTWPGVVYGNCGTCSGGERQCLSIDTARGGVELWRWPRRASATTAPHVLARASLPSR